MFKCRRGREWRKAVALLDLGHFDVPTLVKLAPSLPGKRLSELLPSLETAALSLLEPEKGILSSLSSKGTSAGAGAKPKCEGSAVSEEPERPESSSPLAYLTTLISCSRCLPGGRRHCGQAACGGGAA